MVADHLALYERLVDEQLVRDPVVSPGTAAPTAVAAELASHA
jgi:hypothetical protein